jgi:hypothetical protein
MHIFFAYCLNYVLENATFKIIITDFNQISTLATVMKNVSPRCVCILFACYQFVIIRIAHGVKHSIDPKN